MVDTSKIKSDGSEKITTMVIGEEPPGEFFRFLFFILLGELRTQLQDSGAKFLVTMPEIIDKVKEAMKHTTIQVK